MAYPTLSDRIRKLSSNPVTKNPFSYLHNDDIYATVRKDKDLGFDGGGYRRGGNVTSTTTTATTSRSADKRYSSTMDKGGREYRTGFDNPYEEPDNGFERRREAFGFDKRGEAVDKRSETFDKRSSELFDRGEMYQKPRRSESNIDKRGMTLDNSYKRTSRSREDVLNGGSYSRSKYEESPARSSRGYQRQYNQNSSDEDPYNNRIDYANNNNTKLESDNYYDKYGGGGFDDPDQPTRAATLIRSYQEKQRNRKFNTLQSNQGGGGGRVELRPEAQQVISRSSTSNLRNNHNVSRVFLNDPSEEDDIWSKSYGKDNFQKLRRRWTLREPPTTAPILDESNKRRSVYLHESIVVNSIPTNQDRRSESRDFSVASASNHSINKTTKLSLHAPWGPSNLEPTIEYGEQGKSSSKPQKKKKKPSKFISWINLFNKKK